MHATAHALGLAVLALIATPSHAINPQPLPAGHFNRAINPQPLPPSQVNRAERIAINPQPLPPHESGRSLPSAAASPYIGETEKNKR